MNRVRNHPRYVWTFFVVCPINVRLKGPLERKSSSRLCNKKRRIFAEMVLTDLLTDFNVSGAF